MVEIIPKQVEKAPFWQKVLLFTSIALLAVILLVSLIFNYSYKKSLKTFDSLKALLVQEKTSEKVLMEKDAIKWEKKIDNFAVLEEKHYFVSRFFTLVEENCHPRVWFSRVNLDSLSNSFTVAGSTDNFASLGQQLIIFKNNPIFKSVTLNQVSINKNGMVDFGLNITLDPKIFK